MKSKLPAKRMMVKAVKRAADSRLLLGDIRKLIDSTRRRTAQAVNFGLTLLNWQIGDRIRRHILRNRRAGYGEQIVRKLAEKLVVEFGRGYTRDNLVRMVQFAEEFPDETIVGTLSHQLSWSHFVKLLPLDDSLKRDFYAEMCRVERWSVRTLSQKIGGMLFERTAISKKPAKLIRRELDKLRPDDRLTTDLVFRDPYFLDFLGLKDAYSEDELETAILRELESFLIEFGGDFSFVARQKRLVIDSKDYRIDLLFYHRRLRRLVVVDLKLEPFQAADKGQMELYLRWLAKHEKRAGEGNPIGLILCAGSTPQHVELLQLEKSGIRLAAYMTDLPDRKLLEKKLRDSLVLARERLARRESLL